MQQEQVLQVLTLTNNFEASWFINERAFLIFIEGEPSPAAEPSVEAAELHMASSAAD